MRVRTMAVCMLACGLMACTPEPTAAPTTPAPQASPALLALYDSSCKTCHNNASAGAPQTGDTKAWAPRLAQGREVLLDHSINGYKAMPPMGLCAQCSEEDFAALIGYMAGQSLAP